MDNRTEILINRLLELESTEEIKEEIFSAHNEISIALKNRGYFIKDNGYQDFVAEQPITNRVDYLDYKYYNEINFIKNGLSNRWSTYFDDQENYKNIQDQIIEIIRNLD